MRPEHWQKPKKFRLRFLITSTLAVDSSAVSSFRSPPQQQVALIRHSAPFSHQLPKPTMRCSPILHMRWRDILDLRGRAQSPMLSQAPTLLPLHRYRVRLRSLAPPLSPHSASALSPASLIPPTVSSPRWATAPPASSSPGIKPSAASLRMPPMNPFRIWSSPPRHPSPSNGLWRCSLRSPSPTGEPMEVPPSLLPPTPSTSTNSSPH